MRWVFDPDPLSFAERTSSFLQARVEYNVLATILLAVQEGRYAEPPPILAYAVDDHGETVAAAVRAPPRPMLCSDLDEGGAEQLVDAWSAHDPQLSGVNSLPRSARAVATAWQRRGYGDARRRTAMALHSLETVVDPSRPASGQLVRAVAAQFEMLVEWWTAFATEAGALGGGAAASSVLARLDRECMWLWQDDGAPVSMVAINPAVAGVVRIGPVYTPPSRRSHGYASAAVAAVSAHALQADAHTCILFTDLANPTSNKIYADIGYRRVADWEEYEFVPPTHRRSPPA